MKPSDYENIYFIGIGGIGMSALARYFLRQNKRVGGYDRTATTLTALLSEEGANIHYQDEPQNILTAFTNPLKTVVVYTPAIPETNAEYNFFKSGAYKMLKRSEMLASIAKQSICVAVAGTHGKTTTSAILAHLLFETNTSFTAFLGGIAEGFGSNFISTGNRYMVVEADEYDRSFLKLNPEIACITSMDADHLDIYRNKQNLHDAFNQFATQLKPGGKLFVRAGLPIKGISFGLDSTSDYRFENINIKHGTYFFDLVTPTAVLKGVTFNNPGEHNLLNALAALAMADQLGSPTHSLAKALSSFKGVARRFSYLLQRKDKILVDDYAHHPTEIYAVHQALKTLYPDKELLVVFQPHLYSRTRDFADDFGRSLALFDEILLLPIYPAREQPIKNINSGWLLEKIDNKNKKLLSKAMLFSEVAKSNKEVVVTLGAGDIGEMALELKKELEQ